jgi:hypothetical protein
MSDGRGHEARSREELVEILETTRTIAVVGASRDPSKAAHAIPGCLHGQGYRILPVSPRGGTLFGEAVRASLGELGEPVDVVDVLRPPAEAEEVARAAVDAGANVLWFQPGTNRPEGVHLALEAGMTVVTGLCMGALHAQLGLGPGPG